LSRRSRTLEILDRALLKGADANVAVAGLEQPAADGHDLHHVSNDGDGQRLVEALSEDLDRDLGPAAPAHEPDRFEERHALAAAAGLAPALGRLGRADRDDLIARADAGAGRRRALDGRHHLDVAVLALRDLDPETVELAAGIDLHLLVGVLVEVRGVGIELVEHAVDGAAQERLLLDGLDVMAAHVGEHAREQTQIVVARGRDTADAAGQAPRRARRDDPSEEGDQKANPVAPHGYRASPVRSVERVPEPELRGFVDESRRKLRRHAPPP
jgi:hypothetical protein